MKTTPLIDHWCALYLGKPWLLGCDGPEAYDCWGLIKSVYAARYGVELKGYGDVNRASLKSITAQMNHPEALEEWERVHRPQEGDVVAMSQRRHYHHVGIYVDHHGGHVLHAADDDCVKVQPLGSFSRAIWSKIHFYRLKTS